MQLLNAGGAKEYPVSQTPVMLKAHWLVDVRPGVGGPSYEQPWPTIAPWSINMAYDSVMFTTAESMVKYNTVWFSPTLTSEYKVSTL